MIFSYITIFKLLKKNKPDALISKDWLLTEKGKAIFFPVYGILEHYWVREVYTFCCNMKERNGIAWFILEIS